MAAFFSHAGEWLTDNDAGWQMATQVRSQAHPKPNLFAGMTSPQGMGTGKSMTRLDATVKLVLQDFVGLDVRQPNAITADWPLVESSTPVVAAIATYLVVVWLWSSSIKRAGLKPRGQDPKWLQAVVVVHNCFLCGLSVYMGSGLVSEARRLRYSFWGNPGSDKHVKMGFYVYIFYVSKLYEFMDTVIMLLRRNLRQITFLHLYHHASISFVWWIISYTRPTGDGTKHIQPSVIALPEVAPPLYGIY